MKYLIDYNNETKGGGDWTSCCPICGLHFRIDFRSKLFFKRNLSN